jgi:hypothetical protein
MQSEGESVEAQFRNLEVIQCLLSYGADTDIVDFEHRNDTLNDTVKDLLFTVRKIDLL